MRPLKFRACTLTAAKVSAKAREIHATISLKKRKLTVEEGDVEVERTLKGAKRRMREIKGPKIVMEIEHAYPLHCCIG